MNNTVNKKLITVKEFCEEYGIGHNKGYLLVNEPTFPKIKTGKKILIIKSKLDYWVESQIGTTF